MWAHTKHIPESYTRNRAATAPAGSTHTLAKHPQQMLHLFASETQRFLSKNKHIPIESYIRNRAATALAGTETPKTKLQLFASVTQWFLPLIIIITILVTII